MINIDCLIIGAGPSGISAAIYLKRAKIPFVLVEKGQPGGKINFTAEVENYPGYNQISGSDLAMKFIEQLSFNEIEVTYGEVSEISKKDNGFIVVTDMDEYFAKSVIIASGTVERKLQIPGEEKFIGHGISSCAVCDGNLFKGKPMAVIGGGNSALEETLYLANLTDELYLIHRRNEFRGDALLVDKIKEHKNIHILTPYVVERLNGERSLEELVLRNVETSEEKRISVKGLFEYIGANPNTSFVNIENLNLTKGYIEVNPNMETNVAGLFACGDVIDKSLRQIVTANGDGAIAAISVSNYLKRL